MLKAFKKFLFFLTPFIFLSLFIFLVDPYNLFNVSHIFNDQVKYKCTNRSLAVSPRGNILWKVIAFERNSTPNLLLGDSKFENISSECLEKVMGGESYNLTIPGGNYQTLIDLFWMAAKSVKLENVIIEVSFLSYNASYNNVDLYTPARQIIDHPLKYFFNLDYLKDSFFVLYYYITKNEHLVDWRSKLPDDPWQRSGKWITSVFSQKNYVYPEKYFNKLMNIATYCKNKHINLIFVIAPDYFQMHTLIKNNKLENEYKRFKQDIKKIGKTVDLDTGLPISYNKENYYDYLHVKPELEDSLLMMISPTILSDSNSDN
ncbi:MAG: hypothetical protein J7K46_06060 [Bacteroidales bacterium]|nr:hypothetical protein [Bacteroidales bacterium]